MAHKFDILARVLDERTRGVWSRPRKPKSLVLAESRLWLGPADCPAGWVSVGVDRDTAAFAAQSIRRWWESMGREAYPQAASLLITADSGGSNGARVRLWKLELQKLADETGMEISICHLPPGTSKWNHAYFGIDWISSGELPKIAALFCGSMSLAS